MSEDREAIAVPGQVGVSAVYAAAGAGDWVFVYAPGAGSNVDDPFGVFLATVLPADGISVLRFQFPFQARKRGGPDRPPVLEATWRAALARARLVAPGARVAAGGRSMGGRIASQVVAAGEAVDALALFAYPLHPPGRPGQTRDAHLPRILVPTLLCSGTRDAFGAEDELARAAVLVPRARLHVLAGADHGFGVLKSSGRAREEVWREAADALLDMLHTVGADSFRP